MKSKENAELLRWCIAGTLAIAACFWFIRGLLEKTSGSWIAPLDDSYIHLQYARGLAAGRYFQYQAGDPYSSGATSPLYVGFLACFVRALGPVRLVAFALLSGAVALTVLLATAARLHSARASQTLGLCAMPCVLASGFTCWSAFSGMETVWFIAFVFLAIDAFERWSDAARAELPWTFALTLAALPLLRPEGILVVLPILVCVSARCLTRAPGLRGLGFIALVLGPMGAHLAVHRFLYGRWTTAGMEMKAATLLPALSAEEAVAKILHGMKVGTGLAFGEPSGYGHSGLGVMFLVGAVASILRDAKARRIGARSLATAFALAFMYAGAQVAVPQFRQERYFLPALAMTGLVASFGIEEVSRRLSGLIARWRMRGRSAQAALEMCVVAALFFAMAPSLARWRDLYASDAKAIGQKQLSAAEWLRVHTPSDARVLVCDAGAIAYASERATFDLVGLTSWQSGNAYLSGAGSRFEEVERLGKSRYPTHAAIYHWCRWPDVDYKVVSKHLDLEVATFRESGFGTGERPVLAGFEDRPAVDRLDVADLASEKAHAWTAERSTPMSANVLARFPDRVRGLVTDGGRHFKGWVRFVLRGTSGPRRRVLVLRAGPLDERVKVHVGSAAPFLWPRAEAAGWQEHSFELRGGSGELPIRLESETGSSLFHAWLFEF